MNIVKVTVILLATSWLFGCGSVKERQGDGAVTDGTGVIIEDRNIESSVSSDNGTFSGSEIGNDIETKVILGEETFIGNELDNPASALSNRIVYFDYDSSSVRTEDQLTLAAHAAYLGKNPNVTVRLVGHTDYRGSREYNLALGERRAISIRQILMLQGAAMDQFQVISFGEERPQVEGDNESAWQKNRRVELLYPGK